MNTTWGNVLGRFCSIQRGENCNCTTPLKLCEAAIPSKGYNMQREIGDYLLTRQIGYGSLGHTFLASHRYVKRPFVVKILPPELASDSEFVQRFEKKVAQLSTLDHPCLAKMHNAFCHQGVWAVVSDAVDPLFYADVTLKEEDVLRLAKRVASALDFCHAHQVVHGSLKLSNILLTQTEEGIDAIVTDAGLASIVGPTAVLSRVYHYIAQLLESQGTLCHVTEGYVSGTWDPIKTSALQRSFCERFFFLAPEQKITSCESEGERVDAYALGVFVYYLLTKRFPEGRFPLPSELVEGLQWQWDEWIASLLHPDPHRRPQQLSLSLEEWVVLRESSAPQARLKELRSMAERKQEICVAAGAAKPLLKPQEIVRPTFDADPAAAFHVDSTIAAYKPKLAEAREIEPISTEMVVIPAGTYKRGSNHGGRDEMPRHTIYLDAFAIDLHPVTNEQYTRFLEAMGGEKDANNNDMIRLRDSRIKRSGGKLNIESGYAKHPVVGVTWYGAVAYAKWVGKRLPTEAEWEIAACAAREDALYPTGGRIERADANFFSSDTTPVMSGAPNPIGLFDMAGNVYEWCQDWYDYHFYDLSMQEPNNPKGPAQGIYRVLRGGCWKSSKEDLRCAHRHRNNPGAMNGTYGFRCAADVDFSS